MGALSAVLWAAEFDAVHRFKLAAKYQARELPVLNFCHRDSFNEKPSLPPA